MTMIMTMTMRKKKVDMMITDMALGIPNSHSYLMHLEQDVQDLSEDLATLPQHLSSSLSHFLAQLQSIVSSENSSNAQETLQEKLRQLIVALSSWNNQLKSELELQQQLISSLQNLDRKLTHEDRT